MFIRLLGILCAFVSLGFAEILEVVVTWNPIPCTKTCVTALEKRFAAIPSVEKVEINQANGLATLTWKKDAPFSFTPINYALRWVGVREKVVSVKVRGKPILNKDTYMLISNQDKTAFTLFNPASSNSSEYVVQYSPYNRQLSRDLQEQLKDAKKKNEMLIISGKLFMPERSPPDPLRLIVDHIQVEEEKK